MKLRWEISGVLFSVRGGGNLWASFSTHWFGSIWLLGLEGSWGTDCKMQKDRGEGSLGGVCEFSNVLRI